MVGGVDTGDLADPQAADEALAAAGFVLSLELRHSSVTEHADVVLPIAPSVEKSGSYLDWEGRHRRFDCTIEGTGALGDGRVLHAIAAELDVDLGTPTPHAAATERAGLACATAARPADPAVDAAVAASPGPGEAVLATWRMLLDKGSLQDGEPHLAGTARPAFARMSAQTAAGAHLVDGDTVSVSVSTIRGAITLPLSIVDMPDGVVWLPANSEGSAVRRVLGAGSGSVVGIGATR